MSTPLSVHIRGCRSRVRDTDPSRPLRCVVHALGLHFRLHRKVAPRRTADFVLPRSPVAIFVDGYFWHSCPSHSTVLPRAECCVVGCQITANVERGTRNTEAARDVGRTVARSWE
ncbi:very short patch repair endonuclease [Streptomyces xanthochromogenes]|uniref:very short patch repair endonuclease n=1 Tax=Streptomyces xanthochromogenes TaxID=67384 RepID=UPI0034325C30